MSEEKTCVYCEICKPIDKFDVYIVSNSIFGDTCFTHAYCKDCSNKSKCHTCKLVKDRERFYHTRGRIDKVKCKDCYKAVYKKIIRETPLF